MWKSAALLILLGSLVMPASAGDAVIALHSDAKVMNGIYRLKDIADLSGVSQISRDKLGEIEIGLAPRPGRSERISQRQVERIIEAKAAEWRGKLQWQGNKVMTIVTDSVALDPNQIAHVAERFLRSELQKHYERVEIDLVREMRKTVVPHGAEVRPRPLDGAAARRMSVWIDLYLDGRIYSSVPVWFAVKAWKQIPVAKISLQPGTVLRHEDLVLEMRDVAMVPNVVERIAMSAGMRLRAPVERGAPIPSGALEAALAVNQNDQVSVQIGAGSIMIETLGIAQAGGRVGEQIKVKNQDSSQVFHAKIVKPGVVTVILR